MKEEPCGAAYQVKSSDPNILLRIMTSAGGSLHRSRAVADEEKTLGSIEYPSHIRFRVHRCK